MPGIRSNSHMKYQYSKLASRIAMEKLDNSHGIYYSFDMSTHIGCQSFKFLNCADWAGDYYASMCSNGCHTSTSFIIHTNYEHEGDPFTICQSPLRCPTSFLSQAITDLRFPEINSDSSCYELVLSKFNHSLSTSIYQRRALVMIGENKPNSINHPLNVNKLDWRVEAQKLAENDLAKLFIIQIMTKPENNDYWEELASISGAVHFKVYNLSTINQLLTAITTYQTNPTLIKPLIAFLKTRDNYPLELRNQMVKLYKGRKKKPTQGAVSGRFNWQLVNCPYNGKWREPKINDATFLLGFKSDAKIYKRVHSVYPVTSELLRQGNGDHILVTKKDKEIMAADTVEWQYPLTDKFDIRHVQTPYDIYVRSDDAISDLYLDCTQLIVENM